MYTCFVAEVYIQNLLNPLCTDLCKLVGELVRVGVDNCVVRTPYRIFIGDEQIVMIILRYGVI